MRYICVTNKYTAYFMATREEIFSAVIKINDKEAKDKLEQMTKQMEKLKKRRDEALVVEDLQVKHQPYHHVRQLYLAVAPILADSRGYEHAALADIDVAMGYKVNDIGYDSVGGKVTFLALLETGEHVLFPFHSPRHGVHLIEIHIRIFPFMPSGRDEVDYRKIIGKNLFF